MAFLVEVEHPYAPDDRWDERWQPDSVAEAVNRYLDNTGGAEDAGELEERLSGGETLEWEDVESGRLVSARHLPRS